MSEHSTDPRHLGRLARAARVGAFLSVALAAPALAQERGRPAPGILTGRVVVQETGDGLADVDISVSGTRLAASTNRRGHFRIESVPAGERTLTFTRLGYESRVDSVAVLPGTVLDVVVHLSTDPVELESLVVTVRSAVLDRGGFYARQAQGYRGYFLEREEIERRRPDRVTDLLQRMSGIKVVPGGLYGSQVFVNQNVVFSDSPHGCIPSIWLDGIRSTMRTPDIMRVEELEGVEVYAGATSPGKFNDICGVIVVWTRQHRKR